jgi:hypothetical protein
LNEKGSPEWSEALALYSNEAARVLWENAAVSVAGKFRAAHAEVLPPNKRTAVLQSGEKNPAVRTCSRALFGQVISKFQMARTSSTQVRETRCTYYKNLNTL